MYDDLKGKVAIVTGAGRPNGLGQGMAKRLAGEGCHVVISDVARPHADPEYGRGSWEDLLERQKEIEALGARCLPVKCDVTVEEEVEALRGEWLDSRDDDPDGEAVLYDSEAAGLFATIDALRAKIDSLTGDVETWKTLHEQVYGDWKASYLQCRDLGSELSAMRQKHAAGRRFTEIAAKKVRGDAANDPSD